MLNPKPQTPSYLWCTLTAPALCRIRQQYSSGGDRDAGQIIVGILLSIVSCILEGFLQLVEFLTKFAVRPELRAAFFFFPPGVDVCCWSSGMELSGVLSVGCRC